MPARVSQRPRRPQEIDVVRRYEGVHRKATSTWSRCGRAEETAFTHKHVGQKKQEETSQLDYLVGTGRRDDDVYMCNDVRLWDTWDHHRKMPGYRKKSKQKVFQKGRERRSEQNGNQRQVNKNRI